MQVLVYGSNADPSARRSTVPAVALGFFIALSARASDEPGPMSLAAALALAETNGFDALTAEAAVGAAAGDLEAARRWVNPSVSGAWLHSTSVPVPGGLTSASGYAVGGSDQGSIEGFASGKRALKIDEAKAALASARFNRDDALRILRRETTRAFYDVLLAEAAERVSRDVADSYARTLDLVDERYRLGAASRVDRVRVEAATLEAQQEVTAAAADVARTRSELGVWLGGKSLEGVTLEGSLEGEPPNGWLAADVAALRAASADRPDVRAAKTDLERAESALDLARRERLPDVALSAGYTREGPDAAPVQPPTLSLGAGFELPVFSQKQGEIARAESERSSARIALSRAEARAAADVDAAHASLVAARDRVARMENVLLDRAREARDLVRFQYREGAVSLLDLFDAERTALQVELENAQDLYALRVAVAELEAAVGRAKP
jgi:cobalt-zinc-cadmium efflux system outer membrane protein